MKILISSIEDQVYKTEVEVSELNYDPSTKQFWMRCVMGDDWFQRVTSAFDFGPKVVRFSNEICFLAFDLTSECEKFSFWVAQAEEKVREGYRTMRG